MEDDQDHSVSFSLNKRYEIFPSFLGPTCFYTANAGDFPQQLIHVRQRMKIGMGDVGNRNLWYRDNFGNRGIGQSIRGQYRKIRGCHFMIRVIVPDRVDKMTVDQVKRRSL